MTGYKIISIPRRRITDMVRNLSAIVFNDGRISLVYPLPRDVEVREIVYNHVTRSVDLVLCSEDYPEVPEGASVERALYEINTLSDKTRQIKIT